MNTDSWFYRLMHKIGQVVLLSMLWLAFSLPVITAGAASSAAYYCARKNLRLDEGNMVPDFWRSFRDAFRQGALSSLLLALVALILWGIGTRLTAGLGAGQASVLLVLSLLALPISAWMQFLFACIARFRTGFSAMLKNALALTVMNPLRSLALALLLDALLVAFLLTLPRSFGLILFLPGLYALLSSFMIEPVFKKYIEDDSAEGEENT